jgi:ATP/maltotriose-dependent transcriptional regulator MalT/plasmid maintenance system antidote protein VapI
VFGAEVRRLREEQGIGVRALAPQVFVSASYLSQVETGKRRCAPDIAERLDTVLGTGQYLLGLWHNNTLTPQTALQVGENEMKRRDFMNMGFSTAAVAVSVALPPEAGQAVITPQTGISVGQEHVDAARALLTMHRAHDELYGGAFGSRSVAGFVSGLSEYCSGRFEQPGVRDEVFSLAAQGTYLLAWKAHDRGEDGLAQLYFRAAQTLAAESGDSGHVAFLLRAQALQAVDIVKPSNAVALAEGAVAHVRGRGGHLEALMHTTAARCYAETGDHAAARRALRAAEPWLNPDPDDQTPDYAAAWCPQKANLHVQAGHALAAMDDHRDAYEHYFAARNLWDRQVHARVWGMDTWLVGEALFRLGDESAAADEWRQALAVYDTVQSSRTDERRALILSHLPELASE